MRREELGSPISLRSVRSQVIQVSSTGLCPVRTASLSTSLTKPRSSQTSFRPAWRRSELITRFTTLSGITVSTPPIILRYWYVTRPTPLIEPIGSARQFSRSLPSAQVLRRRTSSSPSKEMSRRATSRATLHDLLFLQTVRSSSDSIEASSRREETLPVSTKSSLNLITAGTTLLK